jgi:hypothetical protein
MVGKVGVESLFLKKYMVSFSVILIGEKRRDDLEPTLSHKGVSFTSKGSARILKWQRKLLNGLLGSPLNIRIDVKLT